MHLLLFYYFIFAISGCTSSMTVFFCKCVVSSMLSFSSTCMFMYSICQRKTILKQKHNLRYVANYIRYKNNVVCKGTDKPSRRNWWWETMLLCLNVYAVFMFIYDLTTLPLTHIWNFVRLYSACALKIDGEFCPTWGISLHML